MDKAACNRNLRSVRKACARNAEMISRWTIQRLETQAGMLLVKTYQLHQALQRVKSLVSSAGSGQRAVALELAHLPDGGPAETPLDAGLCEASTQTDFQTLRSSTFRVGLKMMWSLPRPMLQTGMGRRMLARARRTTHCIMTFPRTLDNLMQPSGGSAWVLSLLCAHASDWCETFWDGLTYEGWEGSFIEVAPYEWDPAELDRRCLYLYVKFQQPPGQEDDAQRYWAHDGQSYHECSIKLAVPAVAVEILD